MEYKLSDDNTKLWKLVEKTEEQYLKEVNLGRRFKSIDAHYQLLQATKVFGSFGDKWGVKDEAFTNIKIGSKESNGVIVDLMMCNYQAILYYPSGEFPIHSTINLSYFTSKGKHVLDDEYTKKVATNALTKGLSKLGFNADVFMGAFDGDKYDYQGIENTGIIEEATTEQLQQIINLRASKTLDQNQVQWLNKMMSGKLTSKQAVIIIEKLEGIK